jgi:hypothetical protein
MPSLITLPIRLSFEIAVRTAELGVGVVRTLVGVLESDQDDRRAPWPAEEDVAGAAQSTGNGNGGAERPAPDERFDQPAPEPMPPAPGPTVVVEAPVDFDAPAAEELEPEHVDEEAEVVYEAGPADDVGAAIHVDAPWEGYDKMRAADIVARLRTANDATRAVVRLYEQQGKARSSVLAATG